MVRDSTHAPPGHTYGRPRPNGPRHTCTQLGCMQHAQPTTPSLSHNSMAQQPPQHDDAAAARPRLRLTHIELQGFKSFKEHTLIGPLSECFTCVIGPNGCGKSVVGEAIAFALGGSRRMLRTQSLAGLVNQELAAGPGARHAAAEVILHMQTSHPGTERVQLLAGAPDDRAQHPQAPLQRLLIKRTLRGDASKTFIQRPGSAAWATVSQAQLRAELAPYGIDTSVVDRYIVTQSRLAVDVRDPVGLVRWLEGLTGAQDFEAAIEEHGAALERLAAGMTAAQADIHRLDGEHDALAPAVAHCQRVQRMEAQVAAVRHELLFDQVAHGTKLLTLQRTQLAAAEAAASAAAATLGSAAGVEERVMRQRASLAQQLQVNKQTQARLRKEVGKLSAGVSAARVALASATTAAQEQSRLVAALTGKLETHQSQEAQHKQQAEGAVTSLRQLEQQHTAATTRLEAARAAAAPSGPSSAGAEGALEEQQRRLRALQSQEWLLTAARTAAASKVDHAATRMAAAQQAAAADAAAAAAARQRLADATQQVHDAQGAASSAEAVAASAEEHWSAAVQHQQLLVEQVRDAQAKAELDLDMRDGSRAASSSRGGVSSVRPAYDSAVHELATSGRLPGRLFGRLCNVAAITNAKASTAVNAALQERCSLGSMLLVSDRATAAAVIDHFRQQRIGTVQCKILSELPPPTQPAMRGQAGPDNARRLLDFITTAADVPGLPGLLEQLLGGWLLVPDRSAAMRMLHLSKRNLVTEAGEVFKADAEIVASIGDAGQHAYSLAVHRPRQLGAVRDDAGTSASGRGDDAAAKRQRNAARLRLDGLQQRLCDAQAEAQAAAQALEAARFAALASQQQLRMACSALQQLRMHADDQTCASEAQGRQLTSQLAAAEARLLDAQAELQETQTALAAVSNQRVAQQEACVGGIHSHQGPDAAQQQHHHHQQQEAERDVADAAAAVEAAWLKAERAQQLQKRARSRAAAIAKELARAEAPGAAGGPGGDDAAAWQSRLARLEQQLAASEEQLEGSKQQHADLSSKLQTAKGQLAPAVQSKNVAQAAADAAQAKLRRLQAGVQALEQELLQHTAALQQLTGSALAAGPLPQAVAITTDGGVAVDATAIVVDDDDDNAAADDDTSSGSKDTEMRQAADALEVVEQPRRLPRQGRPGGAAGTTPTRTLLASLERRGQQLRRRQEQLEEAQLELERERAGVDAGALAADLAALQGLASAHDQLQRQQEQHEAAGAALEALLDRRYASLASVLERLNEALSQVYRQLTGGAGAAFCSYVAERRLLFSQGVTLHVQPDGTTWRRMEVLSGGQRALATLALSFALQALFPSPLFFFDEADCALDSRAARRLAAFVKAQASCSMHGAAAQYLLVSHRPAVFEQADCLVGLYSAGRGASAAVVAHFS